MTKYPDLKHAGKALFALCVLSVVFFAACKKTTQMDTATFELEGGTTSLPVPVEGTSKTYNVKSDGLWMIDVVDGGDWVTVDPVEGRGNGSFTVTVNKNRVKEKRMASLIFRANYQRQDDLLKIEQEGNDNPPFFEIEGKPETLEAHGNGSVETYQVQSNTHWKIQVQGSADWVTIQPAEGDGNGMFTITVAKNPGYTLRSAKIAFIVDDQQLPQLFEIIQQGKVDETLILNEDFNWLAYGSAVFYTTTGETRIDSWSEEQLAKGWTSTVNTVSGSGNTPLVYARQGFVKLGKTSYGGDLISPKLSAISGTRDLLVSFKAVPYQTAAGARDGNILKVSVSGPGTVSKSTFTIDSWPDYSADPECTEIWKAAETTRSFTITGATSETRIVFLGGDFDLRTADPNKVRIFLDDVVVVAQ